MHTQQQDMNPSYSLSLKYKKCKKRASVAAINLGSSKFSLFPSMPFWDFAPGATREYRPIFVGDAVLRSNDDFRDVYGATRFLWNETVFLRVRRKDCRAWMVRVDEFTRKPMRIRACG